MLERSEKLALQNATSLIHRFTLRKDAKMERSNVLHRIAWVVVAISHIWLLYRVEHLVVPAIPDASSVTALPISADPSVTVDSRPLPNNVDGLLATLQRIDARLAQLEHTFTRTASRLPVTEKLATENHEPSARERAEADQRLSSMLPGGSLSREDMARFHADIQALPPAQRFAMATALARAINEGRIQPGPEGL